MQWTTEQEQAIRARGNNLLVAAAAGSGKTAVLIERIMQLLLEEDLSLDQILVVTFTKAAANQMRERLREALEKNIRLYPRKTCLQVQMALLPQASICTLHSFCLDLVRRYFYLLDLDPNFRIGDTNEIILLRQEVLEELLEKCYAQASPDFLQLADAWGGERSDQPLMELVEQIYDFASSNPHWQAWLSQKLEKLQSDSQQDLDQLDWVRELKQDLRQEVQGARQLLQKAEAINQHWIGFDKYSKALEQEIKGLNKLEQKFADSWNDLKESWQQLPFVDRLPNKPKDAPASFCDQIKDLHKQAKDNLTKIQGTCFLRNAEQHSADLAATIPLVKTLLNLVEQFEQDFQAEKKNRNVLDFNDLEHYALQLLEQGADKKLQPEFHEILVDEYQDINPLQDRLLQALAANGHLFMVGDMKQSIYRFRQADPLLFQSKYADYAKYADGAENFPACSGFKINLNANFRSRQEIIAAVNDLFSRLMQKDCGEIAYNQESALKYGADYPGNSPNAASAYIPELHLLAKKPDKNPDGEADFEKDAVRAEAIMTAERIQQLVQEGFQVYTSEGYRPVEYRDIVILMRSPANWSEIFLEELAKRNLPAYADQTGGYYNTMEIEVILALLQIIDNPRQDIPLAAVWRSAIGRFSVDELTEISLTEVDGDFYQKALLYQQTGSNPELKNKLAEFGHKLDGWRTLARQDSLNNLLWQLYRETGFYDYVGALPNGRQRQANLRLLLARAAQYQESSAKGLMGFLRFVKRLKENQQQINLARTLGEGEQVIRLMSVHKSKGLEFPVVIVCGLGKKFNLQDFTRPVLLHREKGLAADYVNLEERYKCPTLAKLSLRNCLKKETLAEEMRILYVALTRAKEKLILIGSVEDPKHKLAKWLAANEEEWLLPPQVLLKSNSLLDWVGLALTRHPEALSQIAEQQETAALPFKSHWKIEIHSGISAQNPQTATSDQYQKWQDQIASTTVSAEIESRLSWTPNWDLAKLPVKLAVSELKDLEVQSENWPKLYPETESEPGEQDDFRRLNLEINSQFTPAQKGTILHRVIQHLDLQKLDDLPEQIQQMVEKELLTPAEARIVNLDLLRRFYRSSLGQRLLQGVDLQREARFSLALPVQEIFPQVQAEIKETVLIQGAIDCFWREGEALVLLDFKTGSRKRETEYFQQLKFYARALEEITGYLVKEKYLYYLNSGQEIRVE